MKLLPKGKIYNLIVAYAITFILMLIVFRKTRNESEKKRRDQFNVLIHELVSCIGSRNQ